MVGPASNSLSNVVEMLVELDLVDLQAPGPWAGEPGEADQICDIDWSQVHPERAGERRQGRFDSKEQFSAAPVDPWGAAFERVLDVARRGFREPPPPVLDYLAWYLPIHYFGNSSAIYIREEAVLDTAGRILAFVGEERRRQHDVVLGAIRSALSVLYLHEAFHHKAESFAIRLEAAERRRRYLPYMERFFIPGRDKGSDGLLEEALACAEMKLRLSEAVYKRGVPRDVQRATVKMLGAWLPLLGPSYQRGPEFFDINAEATWLAYGELRTQIQDADVTTDRMLHEWDLMPQSLRGLFDCRKITHVLVPFGQEPLIPWFTPGFRGTVSSDELIRALQRDGYSIAGNQGKGSHVKLTAPGRPMQTIPANRKDLSHTVLKGVAEALGIAYSKLRDFVEGRVRLQA